MASVMRSGNLSSGTVQPEQHVMPGPTQTPNGIEWSILQTFRSHHERLECKDQYQPLKPAQQRLGSIGLGNASGFFDTGLRQLLTKGDLDTLVENKLEQQKEKAQSHLRALCTVLDRFVNIDLLSKGSAMPRDQDNACLYPNFNSLLHLLAETRWHFELATGQGRILFRLDSESDSIEAREVVRKFNDFFSHPFQIPPRDEHLPQPATAPAAGLRGNEFRDRAVTGLAALFSHLPREQSEECKGHQVLVKLPDWDSIDPQEIGLSPDLDLFLSICPDSSKWHASHCDVRSSIDPADDFETCIFCDDINEARISGHILRLVAINGNIFVPCADGNSAEQRLSHPDRQPAVTLHKLLTDDNFVEMQNLNPLMRLKKRATQRFNRKQKRSLAARLVLSLSLYLDSEHTLRSWDPNHVFFLEKNGQCEREMVYVFSTLNDKHKDTHFDQSADVYVALARRLLEIEYGVSLERVQLHELKEWVDDGLLLNQDDEREAERLDDMIDIRLIKARKKYLDAVRDLLNFKQTYRRGSRRLRGRCYDIGTIAREIVLTDIAEKIRSTVEPTHPKTSGLGNWKETLYRPESVTTAAPSSVGHWPVNSSINWAPKQETYQKSQTSVIELFDEIDESSYDEEKAAKADYFFNRLDSFHYSCRRRAIKLYGLESVPHKPIRIAVLDTGINKNHGGIAGGFMLGRINDDGCHSWVGNDPADVHDSHGHGTNITNLLLQVAPWAEICVGKVFNGNEFCAEEARNVAKAITHAVEMWHADIITMSFGLKPLTPNDTDLKQSFAEIEKEIRKAENKIFFAAAANHGGHGPRTFPASDPDVICIHASDGKGKDGRISPEAEDADHNFMTLGIAIRAIDSDGIPVLKSGTSYAVPIAAALAADILYVTECLMDLTSTARERLRTGRGMKKMLDLMCMPKGHDGYRFVAPWVQLWTEDWHCNPPVIQNVQSTILKTALFQYSVVS